jgi:hypothetical protein
VIPPSCKNVDLSVDHPLSDNVDSTWSTFFKDNETFLLQIDRDVRRLLPDISFFQMPTAHPCKLVVDSDTEIRLHHRVAPSVLSSANVERKGLGMKKVKCVPSRYNKLSCAYRNPLTHISVVVVVVHFFSFSSH